MWASPSIIPTNTSFISLDIVIKALSSKDKREIPFVERAANKTILAHNNKKVIQGYKSCLLYKYIKYLYSIYHYIVWTISSFLKFRAGGGKQEQKNNSKKVSRIVSEDPTSN